MIKEVAQKLLLFIVLYNILNRFTSFGKTAFWSKAECEAAIEKIKKSSKKFA